MPAARRTGLGFHRADAKECNWLFNNLFIDRCGNRISKLDHYLKFAEFLGLPKAPLQWDFALSDVERNRVDKHLADVDRPFAALFLGTRWESKDWFADQIAACADLLRREHRLAVVLLGGANDRQLAEQALALADPGLVNLAGRTSLREAIGIIARAKLAVGPDTGLMHIAAALQCPGDLVMGCDRPGENRPLRFRKSGDQRSSPMQPLLP